LGAAVGAAALLVYLLVSPSGDVDTYLFPAIMLGLSALVVGIRNVLTAELRLRLRFGAVSVLEVLEGLTLASSIPLAIVFGSRGLLAGFLLSALVGATATALVNKYILGCSAEFSRTWVRPIIKTSIGFAAVSFIVAVLYQSARVILGWKEGAAIVAVFFAAEACVILLAKPLQYVNGVLFTLLSRKRSLSEVGHKARLQHMVGTLAAAVAFVFVAWVLAPLILKLLYGAVEKEAGPLISILIPGAAFRMLHVSTMSFYYRFATMRTIVVMSVISLVVFVTAVTTLTIQQGVFGTALGVTIGNVFMGTFWFAFYVVMFVLPRRNAWR
jgi:O-antigen/teichoic acid export membrane protein